MRVRIDISIIGTEIEPRKSQAVSDDVSLRVFHPTLGNPTIADHRRRHHNAFATIGNANRTASRIHDNVDANWGTSRTAAAVCRQSLICLT